MKLKLEQKVTNLDGKNIAYVESTLLSDDDKYTYRVLFDKKTKKRFNAFLTSKGFKIGEVSNPNDVPKNEIII